MIKLYAARDKDGTLFLCEDKPIKMNVKGYWLIPEDDFWTKIDNSLLPNVKWEDEEPTLVTLKIVEDGN
jgi:hypothetical protein